MLLLSTSLSISMSLLDGASEIDEWKNYSILRYSWRYNIVTETLFALSRYSEKSSIFPREKRLTCRFLQRGTLEMLENVGAPESGSKSAFRERERDECIDEGQPVGIKAAAAAAGRLVSRKMKERNTTN